MNILGKVEMVKALGEGDFRNVCKCRHLFLAVPKIGDHPSHFVNH
jgi:hypothetical protein